MPSLSTPPKCCAASVRPTPHAAFAQKREARPSGFVLSRPYGFTALRPGDSLTILFRWLRQWASEREVSFPPCHSSYGAWTFTPVGLAPTDHASLRWTHRFSGAILFLGDKARLISRFPLFTSRRRPALPALLYSVATPEDCSSGHIVGSPPLS